MYHFTPCMVFVCVCVCFFVAVVHVGGFLVEYQEQHQCGTLNGISSSTTCVRVFGWLVAWLLLADFLRLVDWCFVVTTAGQPTSRAINCKGYQLQGYQLQRAINCKGYQLQGNQLQGYQQQGLWTRLLRSLSPPVTVTFSNSNLRILREGARLNPPEVSVQRPVQQGTLRIN